MTVKNVSALDSLLEKAKNDATKIQPIWKVLYQRLDEIEAANENGLTYKEMAAEMKVSRTNFSNALQKARKIKLAEIQAAKARAEAEAKAREEAKAKAEAEAKARAEAEAKARAEAEERAAAEAKKKKPALHNSKQTPKLTTEY